MTLDEILKTAALSLAGGGNDSVFKTGLLDVKAAATEAGYIERGGWTLLVENDAARNGLKLQFDFASGCVNITLARPPIT